VEERRNGALTLPVAPQHASLASSTTMFLPLALSSPARYRAALAPVIPDPTMTMSASAGSASVVRWPSRNSFGSLCQKELDDVGVGRVARSCLIVWSSGK
jgi:hypothetical protein